MLKEQEVGVNVEKTEGDLSVAGGLKGEWHLVSPLITANEQAGGAHYRGAFGRAQARAAKWSESLFSALLDSFRLMKDNGDMF
jgi:hypothetical protein